MKKYIFVLLLTCLALYTQAATSTWTGASGDNDWYNKGNWSPANVPFKLDVAVFPSGAASCNIKRNTMVGGIKLEAGYTGIVNLNNQVQLLLGTSGIIVNSGKFQFGNGCYIKTWGTLKASATGTISGTAVSTIVYGTGDFLTISNDYFALTESGIENQNLVFTQTFLVPITSETEIASVPYDQVIEQKVFFDVFGREKQKVARRLSATDKDLVALKAYDNFGEESKVYLPYASTEINGLYKDMASPNVCYAGFEGDNQDKNSNLNPVYVDEIDVQLADMSNSRLDFVRNEISGNLSKAGSKSFSGNLHSGSLATDNYKVRFWAMLYDNPTIAMGVNINGTKVVVGPSDQWQYFEYTLSNFSGVVNISCDFQDILSGNPRNPKVFIDELHITGINSNDAFTSQHTFYTANTDPYIAQTADKSYGVNIFEPSQLGRVLEASPAGDAWQPGSGHTQSVAFRANAASEVKLWNYDDATGNVATGFYPAHELAVTEFKDENDRNILSFTDKTGNTILKKDGALHTYYVYDLRGRLVYIVPPAAAANTAISNTNCFTVADSPEYQLLFAYKYDGRNRLVTKKVPGSAPVTVIYDQLDRPVMVQDGNQAATGQWSFTKYDILGRPVLAGNYTDTRAVALIRNEYSTASAIYESRTATGMMQGYTNNVFPMVIPQSGLLSVSYYDDYNFDNAAGADYSYVNAGFGTEEPVAYPVTTGLPTGSMVKNRETGHWLVTTNFYDKKLRTIQSQSNNHLYQLNFPNDLASLKDISTIVYDFAGRILKSRQVHTPGVAQAITTARRYSYDHAGRLKNSWQKINSTAEVLVSAHKYNEMGQAIEKNLHSEDNGVSFLQSVDYRYNIRGWLTGINNSSLSNDGLTNDDSNDLFGMSFNYETDATGLSNTTRFNGDITAVRWKTKNPEHHPVPQEEAYIYSYDIYGRLTDALSSVKSTDNIWQSSNKYNESGITYDLNGNIKTLNRTNRYGTPVDQLAYDYNSNTGNKLTKVTDAGITSGAGFRSGGMATGQYTYDPNGNLLTDANKKFSYTYNDLNLILTATNTGTNPGTIVYVYDAAGNKLKKTVSPQGAMVMVTHYVDNFIYDQDYKLQAMMTEEGRVILQGNNAFYEYTLTDHLGNARINFDKGMDGKARIMQENHYYAFGLKREDAYGTGNRFLYSGKELENELDLNQYDYGFRQYDPVLGRWHSQDALADMYHDLSPYNFVGNNPINFVDLFGLGISPTNPNPMANLKPTNPDDKPGNNPSPLDPGLVDIPLQNIKELPNNVLENMQVSKVETPPAPDGNGAGTEGGGFTALDGAQMTLDVIGMSEIPFVSQGADIVSAGISVYNGDYVGAALGVASAIPIVGAIAGGAKMTRRAGQAADALKMIDPSTLTRLERGRSWTESTENVAGIMNDARNGGIKNAVDVFSHNGKNYIIDGHHRVEAARRLGQNVPVNYLPSPRGYSNIFEVQDAAQKAAQGGFKVDGRYLNTMLK